MVRCNFVQYFLSTQYRSLGSLIGRHPLYFIVVPTLFSAILSSFIYKMSYIRDGFYLYSPMNSQSFKDRDVLLTLFPMNISYQYDISRNVQEGKYVTFHASAKNKSSIFNNHIFDEILSLDLLVRNWSVEFNGESWNYGRLCAKNDGKCQGNTALNLKDKLREIQKKDFKFNYPVNVDPYTYRVTPYAQNLGGVTVDEDGAVVDALAFRLIYTLNFDDKECSGAMEKWETTLLEEIGGKEFQYLKVSMFGSTTFESQVKDFTNSALPLCGFSIILILVFSVLTCMTTDWVRSKPWLGVSSCISSGLAVVATFGFTTILNIGYADATISLPFLMLGMGIDDSFVLISAWRRTDPRDSVAARMGDSFSEATVSITITSLTSFLSFCIGITTSLPVVKIFCIYASIAIFFTYAYQITFFGACMALSGFREERNEHPFLCCCKHVRGGVRKESKNRNNEDLILRLFRNRLGHLLTTMPVKIIVVLLYAINLSISIWGLTRLKEGLSMQKTLPSNSRANEYFEDFYRYFSRYAHRIQVIITEPLNYADPTVQQKIENTLKSFEKNPFITDSSLTESWLRAYKMFSDSPISAFSLGAYDLSEKQDFINGLYNVFLRFPQTKNFKRDIVFNDDYSEIKASRFFLLCDNIRDGADERQLLLDLRNIAKNSSISVIIYSLLFPFYEQMIEAKTMTIQTVCIAAFLMMITFFIFIPSFMCALCVAAVIITIEIETIGYMVWWDVNLDIFSLIHLIMCVGFSVNYPSHITYAYVTSKHKSNDERLKTALYAVGMPIFQGSTSTILGVIVLSLNPSYMFLVFVKIIFLVIIITAFHSLFFLPVLLNIFDGLCTNFCHFEGFEISLTTVDSRDVDHQYIPEETKKESCPLRNGVS